MAPLSPSWILPTLIAVTAALHIRAEYRGPRWRVYLFKPLTTLLILLLAALNLDPQSGGYQEWIIGGLLFSLFGDIFLMMPQDRFIQGLASFLIAHICYILAFQLDIALFSTHLSYLPFLGFALIFLWLIWGHLGRMRMAVLVYTLVIAAMAWQACERTLQIGSWETVWGLAGALLFMASDATLAVDRFVKAFPAARAMTLTTYYFAQYLIARSI